MSNKLPVRVRINKLSAMLDPRPLPMYTIPVERNQNVVRSSKLITTEKNKESDNTEKK